MKTFCESPVIKSVKYYLVVSYYDRLNPSKPHKLNVRSDSSDRKLDLSIFQILIVWIII